MNFNFGIEFHGKRVIIKSGNKERVSATAGKTTPRRFTVFGVSVRKVDYSFRLVALFVPVQPFADIIGNNIYHDGNNNRENFAHCWLTPFLSPVSGKQRLHYSIFIGNCNTQEDSPTETAKRLRWISWRNIQIWLKLFKYGHFPLQKQKNNDNIKIRNEPPIDGWSQ